MKDKGRKLTFIYQLNAFTVFFLYHIVSYYYFHFTHEETKSSQMIDQILILKGI